METNEAIQLIQLLHRLYEAARDYHAQKRALQAMLPFPDMDENYVKRVERAEKHLFAVIEELNRVTGREVVM